ncbi:MAG: ABC transporter permease subunit [Herpetosiphonaceae bacterium]|nr:ABC transporter permease subunit [Herpetosiphonaceae bacterium]
MSRIAAQEVRDAIYGWPLYIVAAVALLADVLLMVNSLHFVAESGLQILGRPFYLPLLVTTTLTMLYITAWAVLAIVRPRDQGALRILFFAPVDSVSLIGGHFLAGLILYGLVMLVTTPALALLAWLTNVPFSPLLLLGIVLSPVFIAVALALGLFVSAVSPSSRSAMFFFIGALLLLTGVQGGYTALLSIPPVSKSYDALLFLRELLRSVRNLLNWISPVALLESGLDAVMRASWQDIAQWLATALIGCAAWLILAVWGLNRRGLLP